MPDPETPSPRIVVFDSNVLIPLIIPASRATRLLLRLTAAGWRVALSPQLLDEVRDKMLNRKPLRRWLQSLDEEIHKFLQHLPTLVRLIPGNELAVGAVPADAKDDMVIAAAVESGASYIVSEDHHLRDLGNYLGIRILSIDEFRAELDRLGIDVAENENETT